MKDYLENLEIGEEKIKLSKEDIKGILKKQGEITNAEVDKVKNEYKSQLDDDKSTISDLKVQIEKAPKSDEIESLKSKIADYEQKEADRMAQEKAKAEDDILNKNIIEAIGDKKFVNDFTKNAIINEIKTELKSEKNVGKSAKDLFEAFIKDKEDIFENPNKGVSTPPTGDVNKELISENHDRELLGLDPKK